MVVGAVAGVARVVGVVDAGAAAGVAAAVVAVGAFGAGATGTDDCAFVVAAVVVAELAGVVVAELDAGTVVVGAVVDVDDGASCVRVVPSPLDPQAAAPTASAARHTKGVTRRSVPRCPALAIRIIVSVLLGPGGTCQTWVPLIDRTPSPMPAGVARPARRR